MVTIGILKQSQNRTNLAAFSAAFTSITPAWTKGWLATIPTDRPFRRPKPMIMFWAYLALTSKKSLWSSTGRINSFISNGIFEFTGTKLFNCVSRRSMLSPESIIGGEQLLLDGKKLKSCLVFLKQSISSRATKSATPLTSECMIAPPSSSSIVSSPI